MNCKLRNKISDVVPGQRYVNTVSLKGYKTSPHLQEMVFL